MARVTPEQFKKQLLGLSNARGSVLGRATSQAARYIKSATVSSAIATVRHTPKAKPSWVKYKVDGNAEGAAAEIRPRGGFAYLGELGSYKHPSGYPVRQHKKRAKFKTTGVRRAAWHPAIKAQPWWQHGVDRARPSVDRIYFEAVNKEVHKHFG